jgi:Predicted membrane protein
MVYHIVNLVVYVISIALAMIALSCFQFEKSIKKSKLREFYLFYIMASVALGYLFASFILSFGTLSFYS